MIDHLLFDNKKWVDESKLQQAQNQIRNLQNELNSAKSQANSLKAFHDRALQGNGKSQYMKDLGRGKGLYAEVTVAQDGTVNLIKFTA